MLLMTPSYGLTAKVQGTESEKFIYASENSNP